MCRIRFRSLIDLFFLFVELLFIRAAWQSRSPPKDDSSLENYSTEGSIGDIYHSKEFFLRNYEAMQRDFKVFVYPGGNPTTCYDPKDKLKSKYASEHYFFMNLIDSQFLTDDPHKAHLFFIPISCHRIGGKDYAIENYVNSLISRYPYWNMSLGADHFFFICHDVGSRAIQQVPFLMKNAIRIFCSPSYDSSCIPQKDVALPQILELSLPPTVESRTFLRCPKMIQPPW